MSPKAVTMRLKLTSELRRLCLALGKGKAVNGNKREPDQSTGQPGDRTKQNR